jgi:hypothetical protein
MQVNLVIKNCTGETPGIMENERVAAKGGKIKCAGY